MRLALRSQVYGRIPDRVAPSAWLHKHSLTLSCQSLVGVNFCCHHTVGQTSAYRLVPAVATLPNIVSLWGSCRIELPPYLVDARDEGCSPRILQGKRLASSRRWLAQSIIVAFANSGLPRSTTRRLLLVASSQSTRIRRYSVMPAAPAAHTTNEGRICPSNSKRPLSGIAASPAIHSNVMARCHSSGEPY